MKTSFPVMIGCTMGLAAMVACFLGFASPGTRCDFQEPSQGVVRKPRPHAIEAANRSNRSSQPGIASSAPVGSVLEAAASRSQGSAPQGSPSVRNNDTSPISITDRNPQRGGQSPSGEALAHRMSVGSRETSTSLERAAGGRLSFQPFRFSREEPLESVSEPLVFTDPGSILPHEPARDNALLEAANQLALDLTAPGHSPDSSEYSDHWNRTVDLSNELLRQRYGGQVWMAHHVQSHHLQTSTGKGH